jgi:hypothetical protein
MAKQLNYKTLLDCWAPPVYTDENGDSVLMIPVGFICTTFTFDAEFFDEECITRFLSMET